MNIGVIGAGRIGRIVIPTLQKTEGINCFGIASRSRERAEEYAKTYDIARVYDSYEELVKDPDIDLVYIATPHSHHFEHMMLCLQNQKPVLCEKAFTANAGQARQIREYARQHNLFVAEAIWPRYAPSRQLIREMLDSGIVGKIHFMTANLSYAISDKERLVQRDLCGGALLDVGVYGISFAVTYFGTEIDRVESSVQMTESGVDGQENITLFFRDGKMAAIQAGMFSRSDRQGIFYGEKGYIVVDNINNPRVVTAYDDQDQLLRRLTAPEQITGYEYEFLECRDRIQAGFTESASMPMDDTVFVMEIMDCLRKQWNLVYPGDPEAGQ